MPHIVFNSTCVHTHPAKILNNLKDIRQNEHQGVEWVQQRLRAELSTDLAAMQHSYKGEVLMFPGGDLKQVEPSGRRYYTLYFKFFLFQVPNF